ncbi:MAG: shikimate dehydrogenase [Thermoguttaceae bacterium]
MPSSAVQPLLALLACPVGGNPTQYMIEKAVAHHDLDWRYLTFEVGPDDLGDAVRGLRALGFRGAHCAPPHRQAVIPLLDRTTDTAAMIGAVNLLLREEKALVGENTAGKGVVEAIRPTLDPAGKMAVVLGAGQIARAVAVELAAAGVAGITIVNRTDSHAGELVGTLSGKFAATVSSVSWLDDYHVPIEAELLVNATSIEQEDGDARLPIVIDTLRPGLLVADVTVNCPETWLLGEARRRGCKTIDGLTMFIEQVAIGLRLWTGVDPSRQVLREAAEEFLGL